MKKIKIGIAGCGRVAQHYKLIFESGSIKNYEIIAGCDKDKNKAEDFSKNFKCNFYEGLEEMIENNKHDDIWIFIYFIFILHVVYYYF